MLAKLLLLTAAIGAAAATPSPKNFMVPSLNSSNVHKILAAPKNSTICGKDLYSPYQYTCYDGEKLCPSQNGAPTKPCGDDCYYPFQYNCKNGTIEELKKTDKPFYLLAHNPTKFSWPQIQACNRYFFIQDEPACSYCPDSVEEQGGTCPPGTFTVLFAGRGMDTEVPGGQQYYVEPNGALGFTLPHSGSAPNGSIFNVDAYNGGAFLLPGTNGWMACPANQTGKAYQIFAQLPSVNFNSNCFGINIVTVAYETSGGKSPAAWEYI